VRSIAIVEVFTDNLFIEAVPGPDKPGKQVVFFDDLLNAQNQKVGTHSGFATLAREMPTGQRLYQYQAVYSLTAGQQQGQVTARGLVAFEQGAFVGSPKVAITGGTEANANARSQVTWTANVPLPPPPDRRLTKHTLDIVP
jgi:hypothetical protein